MEHSVNQFFFSIHIPHAGHLISEAEVNAYIRWKFLREAISFGIDGAFLALYLTHI